LLEEKKKRCKSKKISPREIRLVMDKDFDEPTPPREVCLYPVKDLEGAPWSQPLTP